MSGHRGQCDGYKARVLASIVHQGLSSLAHGHCAPPKHESSKQPNVSPLLFFPMRYKRFLARVPFSLMLEITYGYKSHRVPPPHRHGIAPWQRGTGYRGEEERLFSWTTVHSPHISATICPSTPPTDGGPYHGRGIGPLHPARVPRRWTWGTLHDHCC